MQKARQLHFLFPGHHNAEYTRGDGNPNVDICPIEIDKRFIYMTGEKAGALPSFGRAILRGQDGVTPQTRIYVYTCMHTPARGTLALPPALPRTRIYICIHSVNLGE